MEKFTSEDMSDVIDHLSKLKGLKEDDLTEEAMLRSRIDQQCSVISVLKQRADEYLTKYMNQDEELADLRRTKNELEVSLKEERAKRNLTLERFNNLDSNHLEMIKLKDDYKTENDKLRKQNAELLIENETMCISAFKRLGDDILKLEIKLKETEEMKETLYQQKSFLTTELQRKEKEFETIKKEVELEKDKARKKLQDSDTNELAEKNELKREVEEYKNKVEALEEEKRKMTLTLTNADTEIEVKEAEIAVLKSKLDLEARKSKELAERLRHELGNVRANLQVKKLKAELEQVKDILLEKNKEYEAFKTHSTYLLQKEKDLNQKLRRLHVSGL